MKPNRDSSDLAARLTTAATKPPPLPSSTTDHLQASIPTTYQATPVARRGRPISPTVGISLRPSKALLQRYTMAAATRTQQEGRVISAQEIMLEQLERGP